MLVLYKARISQQLVVLKCHITKMESSGLEQAFLGQSDLQLPSSPTLKEKKKKKRNPTTIIKKCKTTTKKKMQHKKSQVLQRVLHFH